MRRPDYQNLGDNLEEITDARNEAIRAWGKQILADADSHILVESVRDGGDWDLIEDETDGDSSQEEVPEPIEETPEPTPAVEETPVEPTPTVPEPEVPTVVEPPKTPKPRTPRATATS